MFDVTELFQLYRLALRDVWNRHFWMFKLLEDWDAADAFRDIVTPGMMRALLLPSLDLSLRRSHSRIDTSQVRFFVVPNIHSHDGSRVAPIRISPGDLQFGSTWDAEPHLVSSDDVTLRFIDFFDFGRVGFRDFRYYYVRIESSDRYPEIIGKGALVDVQDALVVFDDGPQE